MSLFVAVSSPPTPAPSPPPTTTTTSTTITAGSSSSPTFSSTNRPATTRRPTHPFLPTILSILPTLPPEDLQMLADELGPLLPSDWNKTEMGKEKEQRFDPFIVLPTELSLSILGLLDDVRDLVHVSKVSKRWNDLAEDDKLWKGLCLRVGFGLPGPDSKYFPGLGLPGSRWRWKKYFENEVEILKSWEKGGYLLRAHRVPFASAPTQRPSNSFRIPNPNLPPPPPPTSPPSSLFRSSSHSRSISSSKPSSGSTSRSILANDPSSSSFPSSESQTTITSLTLSSKWVVVGLANSRIHVFSAKTGVLHRTLVGHNQGVWALGLTEGYRDSGPGMEDGDFRAGDSIGNVENVEKEEQNEEMKNVSKGKEKEHDQETVIPERQRQWEWKGIEYPDDPSRTLPEDLRLALGLPSIPLPVPSNPPPSNDLTANSTHGCSRAYSKPGSNPSPNPGLRSTPTSTSLSFGNPSSLLLSGGCDKLLKLWDVESGRCIYTMKGHEGTVRCLRVLHGYEFESASGFGLAEPQLEAGDGMGLSSGDDVVAEIVAGKRVMRRVVGRAVAVSGSRDGTIRVWDLRRGRAWGSWSSSTKSIGGEEAGVLRAHVAPIRVMDTCGHVVVSGGDDGTVRVWDLSCLPGWEWGSSSRDDVSFSSSVNDDRHSYGSKTIARDFESGRKKTVLRHTLSGHLSPIYSLAFDGVRVVSGGLDTTVRVWDVEGGECIALLTNHTSLVCQIQLSPGTEMWGNPSCFIGKGSTLSSTNTPSTKTEKAEKKPKPTPLLATASSSGQVIVYDIRPSPPSPSTSNPSTRFRHYNLSSSSSSTSPLSSPSTSYKPIAKILAHDAAAVTGLQFVEGPGLGDVFPSIAHASRSSTPSTHSHLNGSSRSTSWEGDVVAERELKDETLMPTPMLLTSGNDGGVRLWDLAGGKGTGGTGGSLVAEVGVDPSTSPSGSRSSKKAGKGDRKQNGINEEAQAIGLGLPREGVWKVACGPCFVGPDSVGIGEGERVDRKNLNPYVLDVKGGPITANNIEDDGETGSVERNSVRDCGSGCFYGGQDRKDICAVMGRRAGKTVMEIWRMGPEMRPVD
ncbi:WD40 repeat-like protein [Dendrothele bispora CBS 962.96]|uniref:WD40 repeat-like protein n=1 Tax=Dendrothele bispora (strain CBS 962.96) TaxID=1314807 RepID=A0A4S8LB38_DENBC|nr:WD40 repeat-like protein [Dendrothele bispora CBS 962.96]